MTRALTTNQVLVETLLGIDLDEWIVERRKDGYSWRQMALDLDRLTDHKVVLASETLRQWHLAAIGS